MTPQSTHPASAFMERLIALLMPYFVTPASDRKTARTEIVETLASYGARTRAEMIQATRIMAMSFTSLELLAEATSNELTFPVRLRTCALGNTLSRSCQQEEKSLAKRLTCEIPDAALQPAEPINDVPDAKAVAELEETSALLKSFRNRLSGARPATGPHAVQGLDPDPNQRPWGSKMMQALDEAMKDATS